MKMEKITELLVDLIEQQRQANNISRKANEINEEQNRLLTEKNANDVASGDWAIAEILFT